MRLLLVHLQQFRVDLSRGVFNSLRPPATWPLDRITPIQRHYVLPSQLVSARRHCRFGCSPSVRQEQRYAFHDHRATNPSHTVSFPLRCITNRARRSPLCCAHLGGGRDGGGGKSTCEELHINDNLFDRNELPKEFDQLESYKNPFTGSEHMCRDRKISILK